VSTCIERRPQTPDPNGITVTDLLVTTVPGVERHVDRDAQFLIIDAYERGNACVAPNCAKATREPDQRCHGRRATQFVDRRPLYLTLDRSGRPDRGMKTASPDCNGASLLVSPCNKDRTNRDDARFGPRRFNWTSRNEPERFDASGCIKRTRYGR
jgi:hypothetical protein